MIVTDESGAEKEAATAKPSPFHRNWAEVPVERIAEGVERQMVWGEDLMICRLRLAPHVVTPAHDHPHRQMTYVERGKARFVFGKEERIAEAGDVLYFPGGFWHGATSLEEETILIDVFTPVREDFLATMPIASPKE
jgi:quercetin dioxygenase-like cupin family protein